MLCAVGLTLQPRVLLLESAGLGALTGWAVYQVALCAFVLLQIDAFQHMQHFVQTMQQQAQHAIATEDQQHKQELHKLMAR